MELSRPGRLMAGITLLTVPTVVYGGLAVLAVLTQNVHGLPPVDGLTLAPQQQSGPATRTRVCSSFSRSCFRACSTLQP
jgi:hypothetical protein